VCSLLQFHKVLEKTVIDAVAGHLRIDEPEGAFPEMKSDRLTLMLLAGIAMARICGAGPFAIDGLTVLLAARMYVAVHPRQLALLVRASAVGRS
jgi:hypothetical protein